MAAGTAVGSALASIGSAVGSVAGIVGKGAAAIAKPVIAVAKPVIAAGKAVAPVLKKGGKVVADIASVAVPVASTGFSFAKARAAAEQRKESQSAIDSAFQQTMDSLGRDRFANVSLSTKGLERGLDTANVIAQDIIARQAASDRGVYGGGRSLSGVQDFMQKAAVQFDDRATNLALNRAMALQRGDQKMADVQLKNLTGLQSMLQNQMALEQSYLQSGVKGLGNMLAGLQSDEPEFGEEDVELEEDVVTGSTENSFGDASGGGGYTPPQGSN